jgi:phenylalanyl-tRNA synthetase beta chain
MKVSLNWLKDYIDINISQDELINGLISIGLDIESIENQADTLKNFVIGKVLERKKHPNADKLTVCKVDTGDKIRNIVCGAPNVGAGQTVCVALPGAVIPNSGFELLKTKIRGEISEGMICSEKEMNLGDDQAGIMVLEDRIPVGNPFAEYLGYNDVVIDIGVTPNRGDLLSHIGVAREVGAVVKNLNLKIQDYNREFFSGDDILDLINVEIENPDGCYRYCGRIVKDITIKESPDWLKNKLLSVGLRPINNVVDVTNFVMLECGQPLHAFDYDLIECQKIIVKSANGIKKFTTLDGKERELRNDILLICDAVKPVALAGIMGGENSEITEKTKNVFIESAYFDTILTRKSSKYLGLQTDSSYRFERGVNIEMVGWACNRSAELIAELSGGKIVNGIIDVYPKKLPKRIINLRTERVAHLIGKEISKSEIIDSLGLIGISDYKDEGNSLLYEIPLHRYDDLKDEVDLIEEVARIYGYDNIEDADKDIITYDTKTFSDVHFDFNNRIRNYFIGRGFKEVITNTLVDENKTRLFTEDYIKLQNPSSDEMNVMRTSMFVDTLNTVKNNFDNLNKSLKFIESGDIFNVNDGIADERKVVFLTLAGEYDGKSHDQKRRDFDLLDMKAEVEALLEKINIENYNTNYYYYTSKFENIVEYKIRDDVIAMIYQFNDKVLKEFDIDKPVIVCELR